MTNQPIYISLEQVLDFFQTILKFISDNTPALNFLLGRGGILIVIVGFIGWIFQQRRKRRILPDTFPFDVIKPQSNVLQALLGGDENDSLADYKIPYQERISGRNLHDELKQKLDESRWVLIVAPTGLGKTREAANLAQRLNNEGWTILNLKRGQWLDALPRFPEDKIGTDRKLLFFLDDLNSKMYGGRIEQSPKADEPLQRLTVPLQERLLRAMDFYEKSSRKEEIRVIATARNEKEREFPDEPSEWEKLEFEKYPALWKRFTIYELSEPEEAAIIGVLRETVPQANIQANPDDYPRFAQRNDHTFSNIVENIRSARNNNQLLGLDTFRDTLKGTWEKRYQEVVKKYPIAPYIYDAVELLQMVGIEIYPFTVKPTALLIADGNLLRRLKNWWQIRNAWSYLIGKERILEPRDGQIEAKRRRVEWIKYISPLSDLVLKVAAKHPSKMLVSLLFFSAKALESGHYKEALTSFNKTLEIKSNLYLAWFGKGIALDKLGHLDEAVASYDKAIEIKPYFYKAWINRGLALDGMRSLDEALTSYNKAIEIKPDNHEAWYNRGITLKKLGQSNEALFSYNKAIEIKPDCHEAWNNRGNTLSDLGRFEEAIASYDKAEEAIASYDKAIEFNPDDYLFWQNRGIALSRLGRFEEAIANYAKAIEIKPDNHEAWFYQGNALWRLEQFDQAIANYDKAIEIKPDNHEAWDNRGSVLGKLQRFDEAIASYEQALQFKPDRYEAWYNRGIALYGLGRWEEAIASYDKALAIKPDDTHTFYNKACCYALQGNVDLAIENLQQAINLNPDKYREIAKTDSDFDSIREDNRFQALIQGDTD